MNRGESNCVVRNRYIESKRKSHRALQAKGSESLKTGMRRKQVAVRMMNEEQG